MRGYFEVSYKDGHILRPKEQEDSCYVMCQCNGSDLREVTEEEYEDCKKYYDKNHICKYHIVHDEPTGCGYYIRICNVCGKTVDLI